MPMQSNAELLAALDKDVGSTRALDLQKMVFAWDVYGAGFDGYDVVNAFFTEGHADLLGRCGIDWIFLKEQLAKQSKGALQRAYQEYVANEFKIDDLSSSQHYVALRRLRDNCPEWQDRPLQSWPFSKIEAALQPATHDGTFYVRRWTTIVDVRELLLDAAVAVVRVHAKVTFEEALKAVALECDPTINTDDPEALVDAILNVTVRWRARADVAYTSAGRPLVGLTAAQEADVDLVSSTRRRAGQTVRSTWRALTSMPMGSPEWARDATLANGTPADDLEDSDVLPARDVEAVVHMINKRATTGVDVVGPTPLYLSVGSPPLPGDDTTLGEKVDGMIRELQRMKGSPCPPQQLLYAIAADTEKSGRLARALLHATSSGLRSSMAADTTPWTRKWVSALSEVLRPFYIYLKFADAEYNLVRRRAARRPAARLPCPFSHTH
jgi:hypothetical protein